MFSIEKKSQGRLGRWRATFASFSLSSLSLSFSLSISPFFCFLSLYFPIFLFLLQLIPEAREGKIKTASVIRSFYQVCRQSYYLRVSAVPFISVSVFSPWSCYMLCNCSTQFSRALSEHSFFCAPRSPLHTANLLERMYYGSVSFDIPPREEANNRNSYEKIIR